MAVGDTMSVGGAGSCGTHTGLGEGVREGEGVGDGDAVRVANTPLQPRDTSSTWDAAPKLLTTCVPNKTILALGVYCRSSVLLKPKLITGACCEAIKLTNEQK